MTTSTKDLLGIQRDQHSVVKKFETIVSENFNNSAIQYQDIELSYEELNEEVNKLAHHLIDHHGVGHRDIVAIMMPRSERLIISMLAVLKVGAAYLPIDHYSPEKRMAYILSDSKTKFLISDQKVNVSQHNISWEESEEWGQCSTENIDVSTASSDNAYVIYTSGTTGFPKGVCISHTSLTNYVNWLNSAYRIDFRDKTLLFSSHAYDLCYSSLWGSILSGATLHIIEDSKHFAPDRVANYILDHDISYLKMTPSHLKMLYGSNHFVENINTNSLRLLILGGEAIDLKDVAFYLDKRRSVKFVNHYGPTETTIGTIAHNISKKNIHDSENVIGKGIDNNKVLILDDNSSLVPSGVKGEICITGLGVSNGYLNNDKLTNEKFKVNPYTTDEEDKILYRTGDWGKYKEDGIVEFLGRIDDQVKIRGHRIELGEIEYHLKTVESISNGIVLVKENQLEEKQLVAYFTSSSGAFDKDAISAELEKVLPEYMIPTHYVEVESFALTANGKIDKRVLQNPFSDIEEIESEIEELNQTQIKLRESWAQVLNLDEQAIKLKSDFFKLGGHSLLMIELIDKIKDAFLVNLSIDDLFEKKNILSLASHIETLEKNAFLDIPEIADQIKLLKLNNNDTSLFFVHDGTGNLQSYFELVKYMELDCYGIQYRTESFGPETLCIKQLAQDYIEKIKMIQDSGPYNLVGWSFGGLLSLEIAKQFIESGDTVNSLVLIDTAFHYDNETGKSIGFDLNYEKERVETILGEKTDWLDEEETIQDLWARSIDSKELEEIDTEKLLNNIGSDFQHVFEGIKDKAEIIKVMNIMRSLHVSSINYEIGEFSKLNTLYVRAKRGNEKSEVLNKNLETLTYQEMDGDHYSIMKNGMAVELSNTISEFILKK